MKTNLSSLTKISIAALFAMQSLCANAQTNYIPSDVEKYKTTKECKSCDLSKANFDYHYEAGMPNSIVTNSIFTESKLAGNYDSSDFSNTIMAKAYCTYECNLTSFRASNFENANFLLANFSSADFSGSNFKHASLVNANFSHANLTSIDFTEAKFDGADLSSANLSGSLITDEQLQTTKSICDAILPNGTLGSCK